tara:strand:- start:421 stop:669 length:249 start_codon:yes stop_codon:yes gene_type:complete
MSEDVGKKHLKAYMDAMEAMQGSEAIMGQAQPSNPYLGASLGVAPPQRNDLSGLGEEIYNPFAGQFVNGVPRTPANSSIRQF